MLPFHPLADLFPLIEGREFDELVMSLSRDAASGKAQPREVVH